MLGVCFGTVLSDPRRRTVYDAGLYDPHEGDEEVEGFTDFLQEMVSLMKDVRKEVRIGSNYHVLLRFSS